MGRDFSGDAGVAIPALKQARTQYRDWRENGIGSKNPIVNTAAQQVMARTTLDPATGRYAFNDTPGSRNVVAQTFEGNLVGSGKAAPPGTIGSGATATNPAETFTALSKTLSPAGQSTLANLVKTEGYGRPGATVDDLGQLHSTYAGQGVNLLTPEQERFLRLNTEGRQGASPENIPQRDPFAFNPFATPEGVSRPGLLSRINQFASPLIKGGLGFAAGNAIGGPNLGYAVMGSAGLQGPIAQNLKNLRSVAAEQYGAPNFQVDIPNPKIPLSLGSAYGSQVAQGKGEERVASENKAFFDAPPEGGQVQKAPPPKQPQPNDQFFAPAQPQTEDEFFAPAQPQTEDQFFAEPKAYGGRAAYRAGGKVGGIEHLVQALMTKAKVAKKASDKATEPLLNERDDAIASALAVAQKAI
jgi:hypothetical protein